jgi:tetratricopeptide (TPR) repeat protein
MNKLVIIIFLAALSAPVLRAQMSEQDVRTRLEYIYSGQTDRVRQEMPSLEKQYPNDPGVLYLDAILTTDGSRAVKKFQQIVDRYPHSDWADDALYKVYQYDYSVGLYETADKKLKQLKQDYPNSIYVVGSDSTVGKTAEGQSGSEHQIATVHENKDTVQALSDQPINNSSNSSNSSGEQDIGKYFVQTGAFSTMDNAKKRAAFLDSIGRKGTINSKQVGGKTLYVVAVGGFSTEQGARDFIAELKTKYNVDSIIIYGSK